MDPGCLPFNSQPFDRGWKATMLCGFLFALLFFLNLHHCCFKTLVLVCLCSGGVGLLFLNSYVGLFILASLFLLPWWRLLMILITTHTRQFVLLLTKGNKIIIIDVLILALDIVWAAILINSDFLCN